MTEVSTGVVISFAAQIIGAAVMAVLLVSFQREYRKSYLQHWTFGWTSLAVYHAASAAGVALAMPHNRFAWIARTAVALVAGISGFVQIAWFSFGVEELVRRRPVRLAYARNVLITLAVAGIISASLFVNTAGGSSSQFFARNGSRSIIALLVYATIAVSLWRARARRPGMGMAVLSAAFFFYGIAQIRTIITAVEWLRTGTFHDVAASIGYVEFLIEAVLAVGMIACLLEDEREAAALASIEIEHLAYHDALTGLPNRPLFIDRLIVAIAQAHRSNQKIAVFFLDLDRFKEINDSLGHSTGDQLLRSVAERIRRCIREGDTVARFGGDEFTLLIPNVEKIEDAAKIAQKIIDTLKIPFMIHERELFATTSIGISLYPSDGADAETLVRNADAAMYRAKESGRDRYQIYAPAMNARALERLALENMLRRALSNRELLLHYQPLIDMRTERVVGFEALARWRHPELGLLLPAHFISTAETSGLIVPIGQWVLQEACRQVKSWQRKLGKNLIVAVNLSARQFSQPDLIDQIRAVLHETNFDPTCLELEITESSAMHNAENTIHMLRELKRLGVRIAMDDFGTGYSSLNYLKRFPIDTLKLDQSFVKDVMDDPVAAAIVSSVIALSHDLELAVVAEGVETAEQLAFLRNHGCDRIQGFFYSKPLAEDEVERFFAARAEGARTRIAGTQSVN